MSKNTVLNVKRDISITKSISIGNAIYVATLIQNINNIAKGVKV